MWKQILGTLGLSLLLAFSSSGCCGPRCLNKGDRDAIQAGGECWCGGSQWHDEPVIRVSVCSAATTEEDVRRSVRAFVAARAASRASGTR